MLIGVLAAGYFFSKNKQPVFNQLTAPTQTESPQPPVQDMEIIAQNLEIPWEVAFLPDNEILITQRPGSLLLIKNNQKIPVAGVKHQGEGGLLGLAVDPDFTNNKWIYLYLTTESSGRITNQVERYKLENSELLERKVILQGIAGSSNHDGGRIAFGPDKNLYITTGDAENPPSSQNRNSLNGKILRIKDDGTVPSDNPFNNAVYSYGHRNSQGLAWDDQGRLFATEHGRSGALSGFDELNLIEKGKNYGWPDIQGDETKTGMVKPLIHSGPDTTWAPAGAVFFEGSIFFTGLRGEALYEYQISSNTLKEHFKKQFGRLRTVVLGPDNFLYVLTNNTDGRGTPKEADDKLIKLNPRIFK